MTHEKELRQLNKTLMDEYLSYRAGEITGAKGSGNNNNSFFDLLPKRGSVGGKWTW